MLQFLLENFGEKRPKRHSLQGSSQSYGPVDITRSSDWLDPQELQQLLHFNDFTYESVFNSTQYATICHGRLLA